MVQPFPSTEKIKRSSRFRQVEKAQACQLFPSVGKGQTVQPFLSSGKRSSVPARREFWYEYRPLPTGTSQAAVQQRRVHDHFIRRTLIFRFISMGEEKWTAGQGHKGRTCPV